MSGKKKRTKKPLEVSTSDEPIIRRERWTIDSRRLRMLCQASLFLFCFFFSVVFYRDFFQLVGDFVFFQDTWSYFVERAGIVGGPMRYVSDFLTSFFRSSIFGSFLMALLLWFVQMVCARFFQLDGALYPLSLVPSMLIYSAITKTGFLIFTDIPVNLFFVNILGTLLALLFALGYRRIPFPVGRFFYGVLGTYALYYAAGFFGILALLFCILAECGFPNFRRRTLRIELLFFLGILAPLLFYRLLLSETEFAQIFFILLPEISEEVFTYYTFYYAVAYSSLFLLGIVWLVRFGIFRGNTVQGGDVKPAAPTEPLSPERASFRVSVLTSSLLVLLVLETVYFSYIWRDLPVVFRMCRLLDQGDWENMLRVPDGHPAPLRPIVLMRNLALFKTGQLGNKAFTRPQYSRTHSLLEIVTSSNICGQRIMYEYGYVNLSYRLSLNHLVMRGPNISDLKMLARCSLANGETALARKYLHVIRRSPFHRRWANERIAYLNAVNSPARTFDDDARRINGELERIRTLMPPENTILFQRQNLDRYILDLFLARDFQTASDDVREMILFLLLQQKNRENFAEHYDSWFHEPGERKMGVHFEEGILVSSKEPETILDDYHISPGVRQRYADMTDFVIKHSELHRRNPKEFTRLMERHFGDTYWFFYLGVTGLHTY